MTDPNIEFTKILVLPDGRMDTRNAARFIGLSEKTLAMMRSAGAGPPYVKRGRVFYFLEDLERWVEEGRANSTVQHRTSQTLL